MLTSCRAASTNQNNSVVPQVELHQHPFFVLEGLDGSGKSTLMSKLADHLGAVRLTAPPQKALHLRSAPDGHPPLIRRLFHYVGHYIVAGEVKHVTNSSPGIIDRFWHSTTAKAIAANCGSGGLDSMPPKGHVVYQWPEDLVKPSLVILLTVSEDVRRRRMHDRTEATAGQLTESEKMMITHPFYRQRILQAYRNMSGVPMVEISADGSKDQVLNQAVAAIAAFKKSKT